jgi:hypothetical protein
MGHRLATVYLLALVLMLVLVATSRANLDPKTAHHHRVVGYGQIKFDGLGPEAWAQRAREWHHAYERQRRLTFAKPSVREAIDLSCATYGFCSSLWSKARCESGFSPFAHNPSGASGLFQFLPSTFRSTPYAGFSIWSPYANALAAGWMHERGRGGEWVCQ